GTQGSTREGEALATQPVTKNHVLSNRPMVNWTTTPPARFRPARPRHTLPPRMQPATRPTKNQSRGRAPRRASNAGTSATTLSGHQFQGGATQENSAPVESATKVSLAQYRRSDPPETPRRSPTAHVPRAESR